MSLVNDILFRPTALAGCTSVTDTYIHTYAMRVCIHPYIFTHIQRDHSMVTSVATGRMAFSDAAYQYVSADYKEMSKQQSVNTYKQQTLNVC